MNEIVSVKKINKIFNKGQVETHALQDVTLTIYEGEFISISGPSGCGKSTFLSILGLLDVPTNGDYILAGVNTQNMSVDQRSITRNKHIGYVFQSFNLIEGLTVFENVALPLEHRGMSKDKIKQEVTRQLSNVNMSNRSHHQPSQLSGGQQQRIAIARALVGQPDLLLVDEPTGNLDSENGDAIMLLLKQLNEEGVTIVMVTHDERYSHMAKRQVRLLDGQVLVEHKLEAV